MRVYYTSYMSGSRKCRYWVHFHDDKKFHEDGSEFYDARTFPNKPELAAFIKRLISEGYTEQSYWPKTILITTQEAS